MRDVRQSGFTLIEALLAVTLLGVVLLGSGIGLLDGLRALEAAQHRAVATELAMDLAERLRANRHAAADYEAALDDEEASDVPACVPATPCAAATRAAADVAEWRQRLGAVLPGASDDVHVELAADGSWSSLDVAVKWMDRSQPQVLVIAVAGDDA
jgi:type IV pilus assembly protein PilV